MRSHELIASAFADTVVRIGMRANDYMRSKGSALHTCTS